MDKQYIFTKEEAKEQRKLYRKELYNIYGKEQANNMLKNMAARAKYIQSLAK